LLCSTHRLLSCSDVCKLFNVSYFSTALSDAQAYRYIPSPYPNAF
jgi:hypothetical protein